MQNAPPTRNPRPAWSAVVTTLSVLLGLVLATGTAQAVPAFARKYHTTCQTCHGVPPKLNPFGMAFRRNGYRFPENGDEAMRKDEPVPLGQEANADLFPEAVWPGDLPGASTMSIVMQGALVLSENVVPAHVHGAVPAIGAKATPEPGSAKALWGTEFGLNEAALVWGGTLGETLAYFGKVAFGTGAHAGTTVERPQVVWTPFGATLGFRMGLYEPGLTPALSMHRNTMGHDLLFTSSALGDNTWAPEPEQLGVESFGVFGDGRIGYTAGVVEGSGNVANRAKDFYGRLEYKLGGMRLDGVGGTTETKPWREWSITAGAFGYKGFATFQDPTHSLIFARQSDSFYRVGGDINAFLGDVNLMLAGFHQGDQRPIFADRNSGSLQGGVAQLEYTIFPWLVPAARYEVFRQTLPPDVKPEMGHHLTLGINMLARADVYVRVVGRLIAERGDSLAAKDVTLIAGWAL